MADRDLSDYVEVRERIEDFRRQHPQGSLRGDFRMIQVGDQHLIAYRAEACRTPDDPAPGVGCAWELVPGRTPFTRGSELQNAETSAWGRAIIAVGASDSKRGIASREEVEWRRAERDSPPCPVCGSLWPDCGHRNADGSLSRRGTTDAEKAAAGVMTARQQREHNQLAKPPPNTGEVERFSGAHFHSESAPDKCTVDCVVPVDDRWTSDAPSWLVGVDPPEDQPGSILPAQRSQIMAVYTALGIKGRDERIDDMNVVLLTAGLTRPESPHLESVNDLSHQQAARLLENLHERHTGKMTRR